MPGKDFKELLFDAVLTLENSSECAEFFEDICTPKELQAISQRLAVAKLLSEGCVYNEIVETTGASTATISRVSRTMSVGLKKAFERLNK